MDLYQQLIALGQVIMIDLVLAGDNAIVVGMAASRVAPEMRTRVIFWGIGGAVALRVLFAAMAMQLLAIVGLMLAGGILLLWVCWKMYRELVESRAHELALAGGPSGSVQEPRESMSFGSALVAIIV